MQKDKGPKRTNVTFLASVRMTITALGVIPFIAVFGTKCMSTVFVIKIIWLVLLPSSPIHKSTISPSKVSLCEDVVEPQPRFSPIVAVLYVNVLLIAANINKN